jgi:hypothetical protein
MASRRRVQTAWSSICKSASFLEAFGRFVIQILEMTVNSRNEKNLEMRKNEKEKDNNSMNNY